MRARLFVCSCSSHSPVVFFGPVSCPTPVLLILLFDQVFATSCSFPLASVLFILEQVHLWGRGSCFCLWQPEHFSSFSYLFRFLPFGITGRGHIWANSWLTLGWAASLPQDPNSAFAYLLPCSKVPLQWSECDSGSYLFALLIYLMYPFILDVAIHLSWIIINIYIFIYFLFLFHFFSLPVLAAGAL